MSTSSEELLRIGELSKRSGVSPELLRAWERRYGLLRPTRSAGGLRLYSAADVERVRSMREHLGRGLAAAEAAAAAMSAQASAPPTEPAPALGALRDELATALDAFDEPRAQALLDRMLATLTVDTLLSEVVLPYLRELGARWERGEASIAQEHFASGILRGRLLGLARGWGLGVGPTAVLACLPGELHDLGLIAFGLALRSRGWRVVFLGADSPIETVEEASRRTASSLVVISTADAERVERFADRLGRLAAGHRVALGAPPGTGDRVPEGILPLTGDLTADADRVTGLVQSRPSSGAR